MTPGDNELRFAEHLRDRKPPAGVDVQTALAHFAIITFQVDPAEARKLVHPRFELDVIKVDGCKQALLSVVPFVDFDFHFSGFPWLKWTFGQTNYRIYVTDSETGEHVVWFLGTTLDSSSVAIPRYLWKLPWHRGHIQFDCEYDESRRAYSKYRMTTSQSWADACLELEDSGKPPTHLRGFDNLETGLVVLTHPRIGYYFRRDGRLGSYSIWHDRLEPNMGSIVSSKFELLDRLQLTDSSEAGNVHSVLVMNRADFTVYLPPGLVASAVGRAVG